jgi:hypothetical protein
MFSLLATHFTLGPHPGTYVQGAPYINNVVACLDISVRRARLITNLKNAVLNTSTEVPSVGPENSAYLETSKINSPDGPVHHYSR